MSKIKSRTSYNIASSVLDEFEKIANKTAINKSRLVELLITEWIIKQKLSQENDGNYFFGGGNNV